MTVEARPPTADAAGRIRRALRRPGDALPAAPIGTVPILWNNVDQPSLAPTIDAATVLDEIARTGYEGTQEGRGFPRGEPLRQLLAERDLRLSEVYASIPCSTDGPLPGASESARDRLAVLHEGGGDVLVAALDASPDRSAWSGRAKDPEAPRLTEDGWRRLVVLVERLAAEARDLGHGFAWHAHTATYIETAQEADRLFELTAAGGRVGICLDVGHWTVGGGDPVPAIRQYGTRIEHVHLKDVDAEVLDAMRQGRISDLGHGFAWHAHTATYIETAQEADRLFELTAASGRVGICLDVGHWTVGGGDPVAAIRQYGTRIEHVHLKDVDAEVLDAMRQGRISDFGEAVRERVFTELGAGVIDLPAILRELVAIDYRGWLMVEQDSGWGPPSESAAIGRRVLAAELRRLGSERGG